MRKKFPFFLFFLIFFVFCFCLIGQRLISVSAKEDCAQSTECGIPLSLSSNLDEEEVEITSSSLGLPNVLFSPDSPFYFLQTIYEKIRFLIIRQVENRAQYLLSLAEKRLAEAVRAAEEGKIVLSQKMVGEYNKKTEEAIEKIEETQISGKDVLGLIRKMQSNNLKEQSVLKIIEEQTEFHTQKAVDLLKEESIKSLERIFDTAEKFKTEKEIETKEEIEKRLGQVLGDQAIREEDKDRLLEKAEKAGIKAYEKIDEVYVERE